MQEERKVILIMESLNDAVEKIEAEIEEMEKQKPNSGNAGVFELALKSKKERKKDLIELHKGIKDNYIPKEATLIDIFDKI